MLRWEGMPSPDGKLDRPPRQEPAALAPRRRDRQGRRCIATNKVGDFGDLAWSPGRPWLAYGAPSHNLFGQLYLYTRRDGHERRR